MKFDFGKMGNFMEGAGPIKDDSIVLTFNGAIAVRREDGSYVCYNSINNTIENQCNFVINGSNKMIVVVPVNEVIAGDIVSKNGKYYQVLKSIANSDEIEVVNLGSGSKETLFKEVTPFGVNFYYKVVSFAQNCGMNPMMLAFLDNEDGESDGMNSFMKNMMEMNMMQMFMGEQQQVQPQQGFGMSMFGNMFGTQQHPVDAKDEIIKTQEEIIKKLDTDLKRVTERLNELSGKSHVTTTAKASIVNTDIEK